MVCVLLQESELVGLQSQLSQREAEAAVLGGQLQVQTAELDGLTQDNTANGETRRLLQQATIDIVRVTSFLCCLQAVSRSLFFPAFHVVYPEATPPGTAGRERIFEVCSPTQPNDSSYVQVTEAIKLVKYCTLLPCSMQEYNPTYTLALLADASILLLASELLKPIS